MSFDDEYDEEYDDEMSYDDSDYGSRKSGDIINDKMEGEIFHPLNISDPKSAYFFLSDDAQDEIDGKQKQKMKRISCGHKFQGSISDRCPECFSNVTQEVF